MKCLCGKEIKGKATKYPCSVCGAALPMHPECITGNFVCFNPRKQPVHNFSTTIVLTVTSSGSGGSSDLSLSSSLSSSLSLISLSPSLPCFAVTTPFEKLREDLVLLNSTSKGGFCHGCHGKSASEELNRLILDKRWADALRLFAKTVIVVRQEWRQQELESMQKTFSIMKKEDDGYKQLERRIDKATEMVVDLKSDLGIIGKLVEDSEGLGKFVAEAYRCYRENVPKVSPAHKVVMRMFAYIERKSAHCVISNQYLEYYSPQIIASFHQIINPDRYLLVWHTDDDPENPYWELIGRAIEGIVAPAKFGSGSPEKRFSAVMYELCRSLELMQQFPMGVAWLLGTARCEIATMARRYGVKSKLATPIPNQDEPPKEGGSDPLKDDSGHGAGTDTCVQIYRTIGDCRIGAFEVGKQCESCEVDQGEDPLVMRFLKRECPVGISLGKLVEKYHRHGGAWMVTVDFLRDGLDALGKKYLTAVSSNDTRKKWAEPLIDPENWLYFNLYYCICMLEASYGLSPFRKTGWPHLNPFTLEHM